MKRPHLTILVVLMLVATAVHIGNVTHAEGDPVKEQRERGLRLFVEIRKELTATGQTNVVAKLDRMVNSMLLEQATHELGQEVGVLTRVREGKYTNVIHSLEIDLGSTLVSFTGFQETGLLGPADDVQELALAVHRALSRLQYLGSPQWRWDGFPDETPSTPEPQAA